LGHVTRCASDCPKQLQAFAVLKNSKFKIYNFPYFPQNSYLAKHQGESYIHSRENYRQRITIEPGKRGGKPCIRHMRITVYDILGWLAAGMTNANILADFPELTAEDIQAALAFAAGREHHIVAATA